MTETTKPGGTDNGTEVVHMRAYSPFYYADGAPMLAWDHVKVTTGSFEDGTLVTSQARIIGFSTTPIPDTIHAVSQVIVRDAEKETASFRVSPARVQFISR